MAQTGEKYTEALRALQEAAREAADRGGAVDRPPSGFQLRRFTEQSRQVVVLAREEAHTLKHDFVGGEHILLGLLRERGFAAWVLESLGVTVERVRVRVVEIVGLGETVRGRIPFTSGAKEALEFALREAFELGHNYIGTEHILLGLVRQNEGIAKTVLVEQDADPPKIREEVLRRLSGGGRLRIAKGHEPEATHALTPGVTSEDPKSFLEQTGRTRRLTAQEEVELAKRIQRGDHKAKREMVKSNLRLVASIAEEYRGQGLSLAELNSAGIRGLVHAAGTFDHGKGFRFSSYASRWVRQAIVRALADPSG